VGMERSFVLTSKGNAGIDFQSIAARLSPNGSAPQQSHMERHAFNVSARLGMRVVQSNADEVVVAMRLDDLKYVVDGMADERVSVLKAPFLVRYTTHGELKGFEFPNKFPEEGATAIRGLVEPLQVVLGSGAVSSWQVGEKNSSGSSTVRYQVTGVDAAKNTATLSRVVTAARRAFAGDTSAQLSTRVAASSGEVEWALDGSGMKRMTVSEKMTSSSGRNVVTETESLFTAAPASTAVDGLPTSMRDAQTALRDPSHARASFYRVHPSLEAQVKGVDWNTALTAYMRKVDQVPSEAILLIKTYMRKHPESVKDFARALDDVAKTWDGHDEKVANRVGYGFAAMGDAGHTEAQKMLAEVINDGSYQELTRRKALDGMISVEMPERFLPAAVWTYRTNLLSWNNPEVVERLSIATNIYGHLGAVEAGVPENTAEVVANLGRLTRSSDRWEQLRSVVALGNVASPELTLPFAEPLLQSRDEVVRGTAYSVFNRAHGEENFKKFESYFARERSGRAIRDATAVAFTMDETAARNTWAAQEALKDSELVVRTRMVTMLGRGIKRFPENKATLKSLLRVVKERDVRRTIFNYVAPTARGAQ
jgi:hypothetical protein